MARRYDAFISYSHAADGQLAPAIQRGLHQMARGWNQRRALDVFLDRTGLAADPGLWSSIRESMDEARYFILLASPDSAASVWVNREISHWLEKKSAETLLPIVTDGVWRWDYATGDFDAASTAVPEALRGAYTESPRHVDMRWARTETDLTLRHSRFRDQIAEIAAPIHGVSKDELEGEDIRRHRFTRRLTRVVAASLVVLTLLATGAGVLALREADRANKEAARAEEEAARALGRAVASQAELIDNQPDLQMLLHVAALELDDSSFAEQSLLRTFRDRPLQAYWRPDTPRGPALLQLAAIDPDGSVVFFSGDDGVVEAWDATSRQRLARGVISLLRSGSIVLEATPSPDSVQLSVTGLKAVSDGRVLISVLIDPGPVFLWDPGKGSFEPVMEGCHSIALPRPIGASTDGEVVAVTCDAVPDSSLANRLIVMGRDGKPLAADLPRGASDVTVSADGARVAVVLTAPDDDPLSLRREALVLDTTTGTVTQLEWNAGGPARAALSPDGQTVAFGGFDGAVTLFDVRAPTVSARGEAHAAPIRTLAFDATGNVLLSGDGAGTLASWSVGAEPEVNLAITSTNVAQSRIDDLMVKTDGSWVSVAPDSIAWWDETHTPLTQLVYEADVIYGLASGPNGLVAFSPGTELMVTDPLDPTSTSTVGQAVPTLRMSSTADGRRVALGSSEIQIWNLETRSLERTIVPPGENGLAFGLALSADGSLLAASGTTGTFVFDANTGEVIATLSDQFTNQAVAFTPDGSLLAYPNGLGHLALWEVAARETVAELDVGAAMEAIAFSPDGRQMAVGTGSGRGAIHLFRIERDGVGPPVVEAVATYFDPGAGVRGLSFDPSGELLVAGTWDQRALVLDVVRGHRVAYLGTARPNSVISGVLFTDSDTVFMAGVGGLTRHDWGGGLLRSAACELSGRTLTDEERRIYLGDVDVNPCSSP